MSTYEKKNMDNIIYGKLAESIIVAESTDERYDFELVSKLMSEKLIKLSYVKYAEHKAEIE